MKAENTDLTQTRGQTKWLCVNCQNYKISHDMKADSKLDNLCNYCLAANEQV